jgi:glucose/arabinose dehydrogenase
MSWRRNAAVLVATLGFVSTSICWAELPKIRLEPISENQIVAPVGITHSGDGSGRLFVTDQRGTIHVLQEGALASEPFLNIESRLVPERAGFDERGLLGLAFHPDFGQEDSAGFGRFYVYYSAPDPSAPGTTVDPVNHRSVIAEYRVKDSNPNLADLSSEKILMTFQQPQFNHNAGYLGFGPDSYLYITTGDGGGSNDNNAGHTGGDATQPNGVLGNAQDRSKLLGKVLRIDVDGTNGPGGVYGIPGDNPFVGEGEFGVREEIFAYGLRNPWRADFDDGPGGTGRFFVADVGQGEVEEVNLVVAGGNYGWRVREGTQEFDNTVVPDPPVPLIEPIATYAHPGIDNGMLEVGLSVTGGATYRGSRFPQLDGVYLFGDWSRGFAQPSGTLLALEETAPDTFDLSVLDVEGGNPLSEYVQAFGSDESGEVYLATRRTLAPSALDPQTGQPTGSIYRIAVVPEPSAILLLLSGMLMSSLLRSRHQL